MHRCPPSTILRSLNAIRTRRRSKAPRGTKRDGTLTAVRHDVISHTSTLEDFTEPSSEPTRMMYACSHGATSHRLASLNVGVPTFQRAPGLATGTFALEVAMDELAYALN